MSYSNVEELKGEFRRLVAEKVGLINESDIIQVGTEHMTTGYCETCWGEWDDFVILVNGEEVYRSSFYDGDALVELQEWLTKEDDE